MAQISCSHTLSLITFSPWVQLALHYRIDTFSFQHSHCVVLRYSFHTKTPHNVVLRYRYLNRTYTESCSSHCDALAERSEPGGECKYFLVYVSADCGSSCGLCEYSVL